MNTEDYRSNIEYLIDNPMQAFIIAMITIAFMALLIIFIPRGQKDE